VTIANYDEALLSESMPMQRARLATTRQTAAEPANNSP
jgi:hypothetical protein